MLTRDAAPLGRASECESNVVFLDTLPWPEADKIMLIFSILGWQVQGLDVDAGQIDNPGAAGPEHSGPRLMLRGGDTVIHVTTADSALTPVLAAAGLDRLVMPVALPALEQLMVLAG